MYNIILIFRVFAHSENIANFVELFLTKNMRRIGSILLGLVLITTSCNEVVDMELPNAQGELKVKLKQDSGTISTKTVDEEFPDIGEFVVEVTETSSGRTFYRKKYADLAEQTMLLNEGEHKCYAFYGDPKGVGFNSYYYTAETFADIRANQVSDVELTAKLENVKVAVNFGPALTFDHKDYYAQINTQTGRKLTFKKNETRCGYVPVGDVTVTLYIHVNDQWLCYTSEPVACASNDFVTFNLDTQRYVDLTSIEVIIDNGTEDVVKEFKVPAEAAPKDAPTLSVGGFHDGMYSVVESTKQVHKAFKADIVAMGGVKNCYLRTSSPILASAGLPVEVDLAALEPEHAAILEQYGIKYQKEMRGVKLAYVDFNGLIDYLSLNVPYNPDTQSVLEFSLEVVDEGGKSTVSENHSVAVEKAEASVVFDHTDVWATKLVNPVIKVTKGDPSKYVLKCVKASDFFYSSVQTIYPKSISGNSVNFEGFTDILAGTTYRMWAVYNNNTFSKTPEMEFVTENAQQPANNSFEDHTYEIFNFSINWTTSKGSRVWYQLYKPEESDPWWAVNSTATLDNAFWASYWYYKCFPTVSLTNSGTYEGNRSVVLASVAIKDDASEVSSGDAISGELYIGKADNSAEHVNSHISDGHAFSSRPKSMSFYYKFDCHDSPFAAEIKLYGDEDAEIASGKFVSGTSDVGSWTRAEIPLDYTFLNKKVQKIYISFVSSNTGSTASRNIKLNVIDSNGSAMTTENIHAGNVVWLDYVQLHY